MQSTSKEAFAAEGMLQRQLAKKLGIKGKKRKAGPLPEKDAVEELDTMLAGLHAMADAYVVLEYPELQGSSSTTVLNVHVLGHLICQMSIKSQGRRSLKPKLLRVTHLSNRTQHDQRLTLAILLLQRMASHLLLTRPRQMRHLQKHLKKMAGCSWKGFSPLLTARSRTTLKTAVHLMMTVVRAQVWRAVISPVWS